MVRGELLYANELYIHRLPNGRLDLKSIGGQFQQVAVLNANTRKHLWHQTFNFPPGEQVSNETMVKIARDFARDFGFENNQYLIFRHRDKPHAHFHLIANRINAYGVNTATDKNNYERIQRFCRKMERKYGLQITEKVPLQSNQQSDRRNAPAEKIWKAIDAHLPACQTLSELRMALQKQGLIVLLGRGISFTDRASGITFKGSALGQLYTRSQIESRLGTSISAQLPASQKNVMEARASDKNESSNRRSKYPFEGTDSAEGTKPIAGTEGTSAPKVISGANNATETRKDLVKIHESLQSGKNRKAKRRIR